MEKADQYIAKTDHEDDADDVDDDSISGRSDDMKDNTCETIGFYVGLLMKLIPSLQRLHLKTLMSNKDHILS